MIPHHITQWWAELQNGAHVHTVQVQLLGAVMDRETLGGGSPELDERGPGGTGDHAPRRGARYAAKPAFFAHVRNDAEGAPLYMPIDGRGWGRGLMQIDYGSFPEFCSGPDWKDPRKNVLQGSALLAMGVYTFRRRLHPEPCAVAAYNAGASRVWRALAAVPIAEPFQPLLQSLDAITTDGDYVTDVLRRRDAFLLGSAPQ